jgi:hypothetical protein
MDSASSVIILIIFINAVLAIPVAYVAAEKKRSAAGFFFLSFFLSFFIGILVVLALPRLEDSTLPNENNGDLAKCPFCAEWVKSEAIVCKYCGRDIEESLQKLREIDRAAALTAVAEELERNQALKFARAASEEKHAQESRAAVARRKAFFRKPSTLIAAGAIALVVAAGSTILVLSIDNAKLTQLELEAKERAFELASHSDWSRLVENCDALKRDDVSFDVSPDNKRLEIRGTNNPLVTWTTCIGEQLAVNPPREFAGSSVYMNGLGWFVKERTGFARIQGGENPFTVTYGNLTVVTFMPTTYPGDYEMTITRD